MRLRPQRGSAPPPLWSVPHMVQENKPALQFVGFEIMHTLSSLPSTVEVLWATGSICAGIRLYCWPTDGLWLKPTKKIVKLFPNHVLQDDRELPVMKGKCPQHAQHKKVRALQGVSVVFAGTCTVGGIIQMEFKSSENLLPALLLLHCRG